MISALMLPSTDADAAAIAADMRDGERLEANILHGGPEAALADARARSLWSVTLWQDERRFAIAGLGLSADKACGHPWLAGSNALPACARGLAALTPALLSRMLHDSPRLWNIVHSSNLTSIRWLSRIGFSIDGEQMIAGHRFRVFRMEA